MKRAIIIFAVIFLMTAIVPLVQLFKDSESKKKSEMATIFTSAESAAIGSNEALFPQDTD